MGKELERRRWWDSVAVGVEVYCFWSINILDLLLTMRPIQRLWEPSRWAFSHVSLLGRIAMLRYLPSVTNPMPLN